MWKELLANSGCFWKMEKSLVVLLKCSHQTLFEISHWLRVVCDHNHFFVLISRNPKNNCIEMQDLMSMFWWCFWYHLILWLTRLNYRVNAPHTALTTSYKNIKDNPLNIFTVSVIEYWKIYGRNIPCLEFSCFIFGCTKSHQQTAKIFQYLAKDAVVFLFY